MKTFFAWLLAAVVLLLLIATLLPAFEVKEWWLRSLGFPRMQALILAVVVAAILAAFYRRSMAAKITIGLLLLIAIYQFSQLAPYTALASIESQPASRNAPERTISLMVVNVQMRNRNIEAFAEDVRSASPDVIVAAETDDWWAQQLRFLEELYPYVVREPLANTYGMMLMSRRRLVDPQVLHLVDDSIPSIRSGVELPSGEIVDLYAVHPRPPMTRTDSARRASELMVVAREIRRRKRPAIVAGDLNDVPWSPSIARFRTTGGMLDPRVGRGMFNTYHARHFLLRYPLDHVFHTREFRLVDIERLDAIGSDHFPLFVALSYEPD